MLGLLLLQLFSFGAVEAVKANACSSKAACSKVSQISGTNLLQFIAPHNVKRLDPTEEQQFLEMIKLKSKRLEIVPEVWRYVPDKGTCHTRPPALSTWQCREFCALLHNFPSDCDGLKTGNIKCCDFIPNVASDYHIKGNISFPSKILQADAGQASSTAAEMFKTTMTTVLGANENQTFSAHFNGTQLLFQVTFKDSANSHLVQSSVEHFEKYPQKFIKSVLVRLSLANKDVIQDDCSHITDPCECAFKDSCAWANGSCSPAPPGPTCQYTEVNGVFNGGWERSGLRSFDEAKKLCTPSSKCNGISCTGNKCAMMKSATVHPASNATHGLLVEIYHSISGSYVSSLTENSKYTSDKPDEALIIRPSGDFDWSSNRGWMGARFTGTFRAKATGRHYFWVTADDMAELWLNDTLVASAKGVSKEGVLSQKGNQHVVDLVESEDVQFKLLYKGWGGPNYVQIWMANGGLRQLPIPSDIQVPQPHMPVACNFSEAGPSSMYRGCQTKTISGRTCQKWTVQTPHRHSRTPARYKSHGLGDHNYCRNPDGESYLWCYTTDTRKRWEFCRPLEGQHLVGKVVTTTTTTTTVAESWGAEETLQQLYSSQCVLCNRAWSSCTTTTDAAQCTKFNIDLKARIIRHKRWGMCIDTFGGPSVGMWRCSTNSQHQHFQLEGPKLCIYSSRGRLCFTKAGYKLGSTSSTKYKKLPLASHGCSPGTEISTEEECANAINSLGGSPMKNWIGFHGSYPQGCSLYKDQKKMFFNTHPEAKGDSRLSPVCKDIDVTGLGPYIQLPLGTFGCQAGTEIKTIQECEHAFASLGGVRGGPTWTGQSSRVPLYCTMKKGATDMHFNRYSYGRASSDLAPICKRIPDLLAPTPVLLPWTQLRPNVVEKHSFKDCRKQLAATCQECDRQPRCPVSSLQEKLDAWCAQNTPYALARKVLSNWRCFPDTGNANEALDFRRNGICVDVCGYPSLCPGGIGSHHRYYYTRTRELTAVLLTNEENPCQDTSHVTNATNLDQLYGGLVAGESSAPDQVILASSLQGYLDDFCASLHPASGAVARRVTDPDSANETSLVWGCVSGVAGAVNGTCVDNCGLRSMCSGPMTFSTVLSWRARLLENAMHAAMRRFCSTDLGLVRETDVMVTFKLGRVDVGALSGNADMQTLFNEAITAQFASKILIDPSTVTVLLDLPGTGNCIRWRATENCDPYGKQLSSMDQGCDEPVHTYSSGYCECAQGQKFAHSGCGHGVFTCTSECNKGMNVTTAKSTTTTTTTTASAQQRIHPRTYQAEDGTLIGGGTSNLQQGWNTGRCTSHAGVLKTIYPANSREECVEQLTQFRQQNSQALSAQYTPSRKKCEVLRGQANIDSAPGYACYLFLDPKPEIKSGRFYEGYTGTGFVAFVHYRDDIVEWEVQADRAGNYTLDFRYSMSSPGNWRGMREMKLTVNSQSLAQAHTTMAPLTGYTFRAGAYLSGYAAGDSKRRSVADSAARCKELGSSCGGFTCNVALTSCTVRRSKTLRDYSHESSFLKDLPSLSESSASLDADMSEQAEQSAAETSPEALLQSNEEFAAGDIIWFTSTGGWSSWEKLPVVVELQQGINRIALKSIGSYYRAKVGPYVDALTIKPFPGNSSWRCVAGASAPARLRADGEVEFMSSNGKHTVSGDCSSHLQQPLTGDALKPLGCGVEHKKHHGFWNSGYENKNNHCYKARKALQWPAEGSDVAGLPVKVILTTDNPTQAWNVKRRVQVMYGDDKLNYGVVNELRAIPNSALVTTGDITMQGLLADLGTKPVEPHLVKTAFKDSMYNTTGAMIDWPCTSCSEPSGRYVPAWGVGPIPTFGGSFMHGEKAYHVIRGDEDLRWQLRHSLGAAQEWSFHLRASFENRGNKRGAFVLWSEDGTKNFIEFDISDGIASDKLTGGGPRQNAMYISGPNFWSPPNFKTSTPPAAKEIHDISIVKRDCTLTVYVDGKEVLARIPQYWKVVAVGLRPHRTNFRIISFGMTGKGSAPKKGEWHPFCKMYLDKTAGFRVMRKGQSGCLKVVGEWSPVENTQNMKECTFFYFDEGVMKDASTGRCLDYYVSQKRYGLYGCHGGSNQKFGPYREVAGKYQFMRFCLSHYDCIDELDFGVCPKLQSACECSQYPKVCGWDSANSACSADFKDAGVKCLDCDRQAKCAPSMAGQLQALADAWCVNNTKGFEFARITAGTFYPRERWSCYKLSGLRVDRDGKCMDTCGYPVDCAAGPMQHNVDSVDVHDRMVKEVKLPNVLKFCDDPYRYSNATCATLGWGPADGSAAVCASAHGVLNQQPCGSMATFAAAASACQAMGARLCTDTEVRHREAALAGCSLNKHYIWTKRGNCSSGQAWTSPADPAYQMEFEPKCQSTASLQHYVCCADEELPYIHVHPQDLASRTPPTPLTIQSAVWQIKYKANKGDMCLSISGGKLVARRCGYKATLFASRTGRLFPYEENSGTASRTHLCLNASGTSITAEACTFSNGDQLTVTDDGKLFADTPGTVGARCLQYRTEIVTSLVGLALSTDEAQCGKWLFDLKHHVATKTIPQSIKDAVEKGVYDDSVADDVVASSIKHVKEILGTAVPAGFWTWVDSVQGFRMSLAATSFPIHVGTVMNLYRIWNYFGTDWDDKWASLTLAIAYNGRHRNVMENDVAFDDRTQKLHSACGCKTTEDCKFPIHRGNNPNAGVFIEYYKNLLQKGNALLAPVNEGTAGAPWPMLTYWSAVPHDECLYHDANGFGGEYTFRYQRKEIMCAHSAWNPNSGPRIKTDGGVCGRLSYMSRIKMTCKGAPSAGMGQPGHAAGWTYRKDSNGWKWKMDWSIADERVSTSSWKFALTEDQWGQSMGRGFGHQGRGCNAQWLKTIAGSMAVNDGLRKWEKARIAAMTALQSSYWQDSTGDTWMKKALAYNPQDIEIWELFRVRIEQGQYDWQGTLGIWEDFKKAMVVDAPINYHQLTETFYFTVASQRTCSAEVLSWMVQETEFLFATWKSKGAKFDYAAEDAIFTFKQIECNLLVNGFNHTIAHQKYGTLMTAIMKDEYSNVLNLQGPPYKSAADAVKTVIDIYVDAQSDPAKKMEAMQWVISRCRPGELSMDPFGTSYFYWMQFEKVGSSKPWGSLMEPWALPKLTSIGFGSVAENLKTWAASCLTAPWNHTQNNSRNEMYDGCYYGKNSKFEEVVNFMIWVVPYHASGWKNDTHFPTQTLAWLRTSGSALLQGLNASANASDVQIKGDLAKECLEKNQESGGDQAVDPRCAHIIAAVQDDVASGREKENEGEYETSEASSSALSTDDDGSQAATARTVSQLPSSLQQKFQAAYRALAGNSSNSTATTPFG